ncbi:unnamed protein product, partial [Ixodes pacificus]
MRSHVHVDSAEGVVEEVDVRIVVHRPCQADPQLLTAAQIDALRKPTPGVSNIYHFQVRPEGAGLHDLLVPLLVRSVGKDDILLHRRVLDPGLLRHV